MIFHYNNRVPTTKELKQIINNGGNPLLMYHITKHEIMSKDLSVIGKLVETAKRLGKHCRQSVILTVDGYDDVVDELYEIKEVREYIEHLFSKHPYLFYYLSNFENASDWILSSLADEVTSIFKGERLTSNQLMEKYGFENYDKIPKAHVSIMFKDEKIKKLLMAIIGQGNINKDRYNAEQIVIDLCIKLNRLDMLEKL